ncbi:unnamed protein product [Dibothriocephalus latus]|uniref:Uncharacterized protein n=1 Tax=Dibothriocephalus latus TaxID=60516 RepID=A0A3P7LEC1_DIBLA|nr:unnamed protein product [Dibothriocephalus latus]
MNNTPFSAAARNSRQIKVCEGDLFDGVAGYEAKPRENDHKTNVNVKSTINRNKGPSKLEESYTIRLSALQPRSPPNDGYAAKKLFRSHAVSPPTLAYIFSNPPTSSPGADSEKGDTLQHCESPNEGTSNTVEVVGLKNGT